MGACARDSWGNKLEQSLTWTLIWSTVLVMELVK